MGELHTPRVPTSADTEPQRQRHPLPDTLNHQKICAMELTDNHWEQIWKSPMMIIKAIPIRLTVQCYLTPREFI